MKKSYKIVFLLLIAALLLSGCQQKKEGVVAKVDDIEITQEEFDEDFQVYKGLYEKQLGEDVLSQVGLDGRTFGDTLKENILEKLIMETLIGEDSKNLGIVISQEQLDEYINEYKESMGGEENYIAFLESNNLSDGFFNNSMKKELLLSSHKEQIISGMIIAETEAREYYENNINTLMEIKANHILLGSEEDAIMILERLEEGEKFDDLAKTESLDSVSGIRGGDLGYFPRGQMISEFEEAAFSLEIGEISDIVRTEVGYHIIQLVDKLDSYEELEEKTFNAIKESKYFDYIQKLRDDADIKRYLD